MESPQAKQTNHLGGAGAGCLQNHRSAGLRALQLFDQIGGADTAGQRHADQNHVEILVAKKFQAFFDAVHSDGGRQEDFADHLPRLISYAQYAGDEIRLVGNRHRTSVAFTSAQQSEALSEKTFTTWPSGGRSAVKPQGYLAGTLH